MSKVVEFFIANNYESIKDTGMTWQQLGDKFGLSSEAARGQWRNYIASQNLVVQKVTKVDGKVKSETFRNTPVYDEVDTDKGFFISKVTKNPYGPDWITYLKDFKITREEIADVIDNLEIPKYKNVEREQVEYTPITTFINITDVHIGMSAENSLFDLEWGMAELYKRYDQIISDYYKGDVKLNILGDYTDGINGFTARGGHKLKQNLNDKEKFRHGLESLIYLVSNLKCEGNISVNFLSNSNHPGFMDYAIGYAAKKILKDYNFNLIEKFAFPIEIEGNIFLLTHGYDEEYMKNGWPRFLNEAQINGVRTIIDHYKSLGFRGEYTVLRGDQHQYGDVHYNHFRDIMTPAFSNPSGWVQQNFYNKNKGGYTIFEIEDNEITTKLINFE